jgi:hypothetical protein
LNTRLFLVLNSWELRQRSDNSCLTKGRGNNSPEHTEKSEN